jgi:hypothetical protein
MRSGLQFEAFSLTSKVVTVCTLAMVAPFVAIACVPLVMFMLPVAFMALPFMVVAFFGETKELKPEPRRLHALQPQLAH